MRDYAELIKQLRECGSRRDCLDCPYDNDASYCIKPRITEAADAIEELLAVVPKRGEWITTRTWEHDGEPYCSICGFEQSFTRFQKFKYCPRCGAKMEVTSDA